MRVLIAIFGILIIAAAPVFAESDSQPENRDLKKQYLYGWVDNNGIGHITDSLSKVPEQYRSKARKIESGKGQETAPDQRQEPEYAPNSENAEAPAKAEWQQRIKDWKMRLADAEKHYRDLEQERNDLFRAWGSPALAPIKNRQRAEEIDQEMKTVQQEIDESKNMLEVAIPEEARKSGVPPGWLRE